MLKQKNSIFYIRNPESPQSVPWCFVLNPDIINGTYSYITVEHLHYYYLFVHGVCSVPQCQGKFVVNILIS